MLFFRLLFLVLPDSLVGDNDDDDDEKKVALLQQDFQQ